MNETPAEVIRRAAALMRERAEAATPGPWLGVTGMFKDGEWPCVITAKGDPKDAETWLMGTGNGGANREADATHAGSWHPLVALAVARWLESLDGIEWKESGPATEELTHALKIARAYLGEVPA